MHFEEAPADESEACSAQKVAGELPGQPAPGDLPQIPEPVAMRVGLGKFCCAAGAQAYHPPQRKQHSGLRTRAGADTPGNCVAGGGCSPPATEVSVDGQPTTSQTLPSPETHRGIERESSPRIHFPTDCPVEYTKRRSQVPPASHELGAIVTTNAARHSARGKQVRQRVDHILTRNTPVNLQGHTLPRILVDDRKPFQWTATDSPIEHKVPGPDIVRMPRAATPTAVAAGSQISPFPLLLRHFQPFSTPQTPNPRVTGLPTLLPKKTSNSPIAKPRTLARQLTHPLRQTHFIISWRRFITLSTPRLMQHTACSTF